VRDLLEQYATTACPSFPWPTGRKRQ
jgi:hypothetical protein